MKIIFLTITLTFFVISLFGQCDCDKIEQKNGTYYTFCKPFITVDDSIGKIELGVSALEQGRYIYMTIAFKTNPQILNGGLTIRTNDDKGWICVLIQRDLSLVDGIQTAYGLFVAEMEDLEHIQNHGAKSISFYLADGKQRTVNLTYMAKNLSIQLECLTDEPNKTKRTMEEYRKLSLEALERRDYESALAQINKAIEIDPDYIENYICKGLYLTYLKRFQEAYDIYTKAIELDSTYSNSFDHRARLLSQIGQYNDALADHTMAINLFENSENLALYLTNRAYTKRLNGDASGELADLEAALKINPYEVSALNSMGNALGDQGKKKEGLTYLLKGLSLDSTNAPLYINIGFVYQEWSKNDTAILYFNKAIMLSPEYPEAYSNRSYSYFQLGNNEAALKDINKSISLWDTNPYAYWIRSLIQIKLGKIAEACLDLASATEFGYSEFYGNAVEELKAQHCKK